ncbi:MAG: S46 family peptidase, partial [Bacteroidales bacterium]|nr:S46 family peptidase [Bacteroidales bacterium]
MEINPDKKFYPDANFTMRLTYGTIQDYFPADAIHFNYFTTLDGIMEKEDPTTWEFIVPEKLKELYITKDYGQYSDNDTLKVCFLTNHDITGGNSGSPVINGNGELIGLAFDGNWEAMSGDIAFEPELQRTINVDIRYVLFIIDKFAGATNLIDEMTIVTEKPKLKTDIPEEKNIELEVIEE